MFQKSPLTLVKESSEFLRQHAEFVKIDEDCLRKYANKLEKVQVREETVLPFKFDNLSHEINFYVLYSILNFGSGYRHLLHQYSGRGACATIQYGLIGMVLSGSKLDAYEISSMTLADVERDFQIPCSVEVPISEKQSYIKIEKDIPLKMFADDIRFVLNDCGRILRGLQYKDFAEFILKQLEKDPSMEGLLKALINTFPAYQDEMKIHLKYNNKPLQQQQQQQQQDQNDRKTKFEDKDVIDDSIRNVEKKDIIEKEPASSLKNMSILKDDDVECYFYKKAQLTIGELYLHFKSRLKQFDFLDISKLTVFVDNVIPAVLRTDGILILSKDLENKVNSRQELNHQEEAELRGVAIAACEEIVKLRNGDFMALDLDYYLWMKGKDEAYRSIERHISYGVYY